MNFTSQFTLPTSYFILPTSHLILPTSPAAAIAVEILFVAPFAKRRRKKIAAESAKCPLKKFAVKAGNFSVLVEIVVRVVLGVAVHKPHPDGQSDYACHRGHECAFQFVGHIVADVVEEK